MNNGYLEEIMNQAVDGVRRGLESHDPKMEPEEIGRILSVAQGVVQAKGMRSVGAEELLMLGPDVPGMALDIMPDSVGIALLGSGEGLSAGDEVVRTGRVLDVPVGKGVLGRVITPLGKPLDGNGLIASEKRLAVEREAPLILHRAPVDTPLQTGIKVIDTLIPIGRGQRELIVGDRQTGKTAIALDTICNQKGADVICIYCAIGQRSSSVARAIEELKRRGAMDYTVVVVVEGGDPAGLQYIAPYAATSIGEYFMHQGKDVLVVYDDLTRHAQAYRQLSLLLRRPPGREAFPGDIFYIHSRLLERSTRLKPEQGGGTLTALPIIETEAQNISAYIPTNLISITDGQIYLNPDLFQKGTLPAVDVGVSVSRVGGRAQLPAYAKVAGDLRLTYSQFQELEAFARFGTRMDEDTRAKLDHGLRVREILKQKRFSPLTAGQQAAVLLAVTKGLFGPVDLSRILEAEEHLLGHLAESRGDLDSLARADRDDPMWDGLVDEIRTILETME
ncbi:alternate F1F0 ATPase, F1 subunit alpha [Pseudodesulfovibrio sp. zrk46]|uniref:alternate F1F0 ATPase, F1 subunit alpha n=1 Tax=Pseudodesulfovibrio sp. zrk46 TaxID=2725288 RepID=UPI0014499125|nr:alternate F1F0 ATPase, F1 subunit alpha [Pseudodesulfovibrio sp. zrk46]QJB55104.1 alternate F1F0 ATPase, F1 subunit alpha [Pseudodesulfovibrio sp. zrk46]